MRWITIKNTCIDFDRVTHFSKIENDNLFLILIELEDGTPLNFIFDSKVEMDDEFENITDVL